LIAVHSTKWSPKSAEVRALAHRGPLGWEGTSTIGKGKNVKVIPRMEAALGEFYARDMTVHVMLHETCSRAELMESKICQWQVPSRGGGGHDRTAVQRVLRRQHVSRATWIRAPVRACPGRLTGLSVP